MSWTELVFPAPVADHPRLLAEVVGPLIADLRRSGLFLRELGPEGDTRLLVQLRGTPPDPATLPHPPAEIRAATVRPLGGPVFNGPKLDETTRSFLTKTAPVALDLATRADDRTGAALELMTVHLAAVADPTRSGDAPPLSFLSFRSHAEAFLATTRDPETARRSFDEQYAAHHMAAESSVRAILRFGDLGGAAVWDTVVRTTKPTLVEGFRTGALVAHTSYTRDHLRERTEFTGNAFHRTAGASEDLQAYLSGDPSFLATRLLTSLLYVTLYSAGVSLLQRYYLCHAISRACEAVYQVDSLTLLAGLTGDRRAARHAR